MEQVIKAQLILIFSDALYYISLSLLLWVRRHTFIQNQMQQTQNRLALKREQFKVELRRQQLHSIFKKRREELETTVITPVQHQQLHLQEISQLIGTLHHQHLYPIFKELIEMDQSLGLLFHLTAIVPENVPAFFATTIKNICGEKILPEKIDLQKISQNIQVINFPKDKRLRICEYFDNWCKSEGQVYLKVKSLLNRLPQISDAATTQLIQFVALVANVSLIVMWAEQSLMHEMEQHRTRRNHELTSCNSILINLLAGCEQQIAQHVPLILYSIGNNMNCLGVYFNLFLIEKVDPLIKFEMFRIFTRVLCLNHEEVLQHHKDIICMLSNCMKLLPELPPQLQQNYLQIAFKITEMLDGLLEVLNLRYQSTQLYLLASSISSDDQDRAFVHHIAVILQKLGEQKYVRCGLLQRRAVVRFMLNHVQASEEGAVLRTACCLMSLLNVCTFESLSLQVFSKEILFVHKLMRIIIKIEISCNQDTLAHSHMLLYIEKLLATISNCCHCPEFFSFFLEQNLPAILASLYFKLRQNRTLKVKDQCLFVYLNMLVNAQNYMLGREEERELLLNSLLGNSKINHLFVQSLKSAQNDLMELAVKLLCFLVRIEQKSPQNQHLSSFLDNNSLSQQLDFMEQSDKQRVYQCGHQAKMMLKHRVKHTNQIYDELDCL